MQPPIRVWSGPPGWPFRVDAFYMKANYAGKVSNLTVGHHSFIPFTLHHEQGAPLYTGSAAVVGDTLKKNYELHTTAQSDIEDSHVEHSMLG